MNPASILAGLLIMAFAALGSAKLAAVPAMRARGGAVVAHLRKGDGVREIAPAVVLGVVTLTLLLLVVGDLR